MRKRSNRRRKARLACMLVVQYRVRAALWRAAAVLDLSDAGCRLRVDEALASGTPLLLRFDALLHDGATSTTLETAARVMWCRPQRPGFQELGLEFASGPLELNEILGVRDSA
jgi:c-di-GMP-binding flagellar brake protein YcgR